MTNLTSEHQLHHARRAKAEKLDSSLRADYPAIVLSPVLDTNVVTGWAFDHTDEEGETTRFLITDDAGVPDIADVLEACEEAGLDPEALEEQHARSGSVVDELYRAQYREQSSTKQSCGDWLAEWLVRFLDADKKLDVDAFTSCCSNNGVDLTAKWAQITRGNGWQGRFRMNGRQVLEKHVTLNGKLLDEAGNEHEVPADFLTAMEAKHGKWLAKQRKLLEAEKADALAA